MNLLPLVLGVSLTQVAWKDLTENASGEIIDHELNSNSTKIKYLQVLC